MAGRQRRIVQGARPLLTAPLQLEPEDAMTKRITTSLAQGIQELQGLPAMGMRVLRDVKLEDTINTFVSHGLGRRPLWVRESCVRGAVSTGIVRDLSDGALVGLFTGPVDRNRYVVLRADGYGATITVDILVL